MFNRNFGCRIKDNIKINNLDALIMENELLRVTVLLDKGTDIIELLYKPKDIDFMWKSPVKLHSPANYPPSTGGSLYNYLDYYEGGWQEILPNGGPGCLYKGTELGMHGEVSNVPWQYKIIKDTPEEVSITFYIKLLRVPLEIEKTLTLKTKISTLFFYEQVRNNSNESIDFMWGHHPAIGEPFLNNNCEIRTSAEKVFTYGNKLDFETQRLELNSEYIWPIAVNRNGQTVDLSKVPAKNSNTADMLFLKDFDGAAHYEIYNQDLKLGFCMQWDKKIFPYLWMWLVCNGSYGYPWYGRTYNLALEHWTSYPSMGLQEAINNKSAYRINGYDKVKTSFQCIIREYE